MRRNRPKWNTIGINGRAAIVKKIRRSLCRYVAKEDIKKLVKAVFTKKFDHGIFSRSRDYFEKAAIVSNIAKELAALKNKEHQSGAFRALLSACCGANICSSSVAKQLKIHRNTIKKVKTILVSCSS